MQYDESNSDDSDDSAGDAGDEYELPRRSVAPDATVDDRLTDNVIHAVGPARYFQKNEDGDVIEDWDGVFQRVADNVAEAELKHGNTEEHVEYWSDRFYDVMSTQQFIPNSPTLMNAGTTLQQLAACFVNSPEDSMEDIFQTAKEWGLVQKTGGGMGGAFHHLRPKGARVDSTGGVSSGPVSFMELFDDVAGTVKQGGKRRGAQMAIMHVQHPDVGRFAVSKRGEERFTNFNISLGITDEFFDAVERDDEYVLYDPEEGWSVPTEFETVAETAHFYDPRFEDAWNDELDKPGMGLDGKTVEENFWRDYQDQMQDPEAFDQFRDEIDLEPGEVMTLPARFIWQILVDGAHNNGEPGVFHLSETNREHSFDGREHEEHFIHATNPCAEQPLCEHESCNLGHINLSLMVKEDAPIYAEYDGSPEDFLEEAVDWERLEETAEIGTRFLENVVTQSDFPLEEIENQVDSLRKIGLGVMGWHQMLIQLGVQYGSDVSYDLGEEMMRRIDQKATETSHEIAKERGVFPDWDKSKYASPTEYPEWFRKHTHQDPEDWEGGYPVRNHNMTTVAPTGTTSLIGDTSGGIEPIYQVAYFKNVGDDIQGDDYLVEFDDYFLRVLEANGLDVEAVKDEAEEQMRNDSFEGVDSLDRVPEEIGNLFVTTQDLEVGQHIRMQSAWQTYCDSGISKTLNCANDVTLDDVSEALELALELGIKGTTVYRDGSREEQVQTTRIDNKLDEDADLEVVGDETLLEEIHERVERDPTFRSEIKTEIIQDVPGAKFGVTDD